MGPVWVCSGCHNRIQQAEWLKQQKFTFLQFWRQRDGNITFILRLLPLACKQPPFSYVKHWPLFDPFMQKEEEHEVSAVSFKKDTNLGIPWQWLGLSTFTAGHRFKLELGELNPSSHVMPPKKKKTLILLDQGPTFMTSLNPNYFFKGSVSKCHTWN